MSMFNECPNCGQRFRKGRGDAVFCSATCKAAFHRARTPDTSHEDKVTGEFHAQQARNARASCQHCGDTFAYNAYASRGGQRAPKFCSDRCRVAAHRAGKRAAAEGAAYARAKQAEEAAKQRQQTPPKGKQSPPPPPPRQAPKRFDPYEILGVRHNCSWDEVRSNYRRLIRQFHPDVYKGEDATQIAQNLNLAHDYFKRHFGR